VEVTVPKKSRQQDGCHFPVKNTRTFIKLARVDSRMKMLTSKNAKEFSLAELLQDPSRQFVVIDAQENEIGYISPNQYSYKPPIRTIDLLDHSTRTLYHGRLSTHKLEALGTATSFWDADKYLFAERYRIQTFDDLKTAFEEAGFAFQ
jgi:hypothetical protein